MEKCEFRIVPSKQQIADQHLLKFLGTLAELAVFPRCQLLVDRGEFLPVCSNALQSLTAANCPVALCYDKGEFSVEEMNERLNQIFRTYRSQN